MSPEVITLIIYAIDRGIELYEKRSMSVEQIKEDLVKEIEIYYKIKEQIKLEIEKYGGEK